MNWQKIITKINRDIKVTEEGTWPHVNHLNALTS
jgi:hypothetical protein